ncbi:MAG: hypothetical protein EA397_03370 [Deltaproteobacteria bacterium]|nr:MAG: hypothetical protein EA397_03370 [Deltaproteobacteria bacterium]
MATCVTVVTLASPAWAQDCDPLGFERAIHQGLTALEREEPERALELLAGAERSLRCASLPPPEPSELARMWQAQGLSYGLLGQKNNRNAAFLQAAAMPLDEPIFVTEDFDALQPYFRAREADWKLGRISIGPISVDAQVFVDGVRQTGSFKPVRSPARHVVHVYEEGELIYADLLNVPPGDLFVDLDEARRGERTSSKRSRASKVTLGVSLAGGVAALGIGGAAFGYNQRAGQLARRGATREALNVYGTYQDLAAVSIATGLVSAGGIGLSLSGWY